MIKTDEQLQATISRIAWFYGQAVQLRAPETNLPNYGAAVEGVLAEIDRMQLEAREYFSALPP